MKRLPVVVAGVVLACVAAVYAGNDALRAFESDAPSRSTGRPGDGRLEHGKRLPSRGPGFRTYSRFGSLIGRTAVHSSVRAAVLDAYADVHLTSSQQRFVFGETGWPDGGRIRPHRTHQNGLSVDFMVPVRRNAEIVALPTWPWRKFGYGIEFDSSGNAGALRIDFDAMALHLAALQRAAGKHGLEIERVILAPDLQPELFATNAGAKIRNTLPFLRTPAWVRHDEHYHVDFRLTR